MLFSSSAGTIVASSSFRFQSAQHRKEFPMSSNPAPAAGASRPPLPPFNAETAAQKARGAEDAWNTREPARVALAYTVDSRWRNRAEFFQGREAIEAFLTRKWNRELDYRLI